MLPLDRVVAAAEKANGATLTMGVALAPCSLPHTRKPNFELGDDEMEIGLGIHGEPGVEKGKLRSADAVTDDLLDRILAELGAGKGDRVALLVNGLGATPLMELYLMHRRARHRLIDAGIAIHKSFVGEYVTSLEMAGASLTLMRLDDELTDLLDRPCDCAMFAVG